MAYKRTGNPVGRPKTKEYTTLLARVPADLADLVKRYASQHGLSVAEVLREGAAWRIGNGDPRGMGMYLEDEPTSNSGKVYYRNTETASSLDSSAAFADMRTALARQEAQIQALTQMLEQQTALLHSKVYSSNTENDLSVTGNTSMASAVGDMPVVRMAAQSVLEQSSAGIVSEFDRAKYALGPLCKEGHDADGQGHSIRQLGGKHECRECKNIRSRAYKERQRQAQPVVG